MISELNQLNRFNSSDEGAPAADGSHEGTINVLRKVLIEGYGDKQPAGWSILFQEIDSIVLQTANADYCYKISPAVSYSAGMNLQGYDSMTSINDGVGRMPDYSSAGPKYSTNTPPTTPILGAEWVIFANQYCCYILTSSICSFIGLLDSPAANANCVSGGFQGWNSQNYDRGFPIGDGYFSAWIRAIGGESFARARPKYYQFNVSKQKPEGSSNLLFQCGFEINGTTAYFPGMFGAMLHTLNTNIVDGHNFYKYTRTGGSDASNRGEVYLCYL
ncbi:hypothetical protein ACSLBF_10560 [Pseudoalteromonas sp. T1lg65]|uniref:hypothetical protein n=1 Tax=Pseudoalteromonas sp. T1lg65 TaxID=2077101 RepID=UPI003F7A23A8